MAFALAVLACLALAVLGAICGLWRRLRCVVKERAC